MDAPEDTGAGALIIKRIEELLQHSTLPPETVLNILRARTRTPVMIRSGD